MLDNWRLFWAPRIEGRRPRKSLIYGAFFLSGARVFGETSTKNVPKLPGEERAGFTNVAPAVSPQLRT
jgi:hypothetical protein